ncbi:hypothetical protein AOLI_G00000750 [Acnodon oligacanthus]
MRIFLAFGYRLISAGRKLTRPFTSRVKKEVRSGFPTESRMLGCDGSISLAAHADEASSSYIFTPRLPRTKLESGSRVACQSWKVRKAKFGHSGIVKAKKHRLSFLLPQRNMVENWFCVHVKLDKMILMSCTLKNAQFSVE